MTQIPTFSTVRLILRPMTFTDWPNYAAFMASDRSRYMGGPYSTKAAWGMFGADHAQWDLFGAGALMIEDRATGDCHGQVSINSGPFFPEAELGWFVFSGAEGSGVAFEAASALRDWARDVRQLSTLVSYVDPNNLRSRSLAERLGAAIDPKAMASDPSDLVYRHYG